MDTKALEKVALSVRALTMDAIEKAKSGHPGLPMGSAELGAILYGEILKHDPADPAWTDRDRFVLSGGHGCMFLYSMLYLAGYPGITLDDIKNFRQLGSPCAGHPEYGLIPGIEATTGPLGQGVSMAVGMAMAETMLAAHFNTAKRTIVDHYTYALAGDGCFMEGVSGEAASLAGHMKLGKLIIFYDSNGITIDGSTQIAFTEDVGKRYEAYNWQVLKGDMYDFEGIAKLVREAKAETGKPSLIILKSTIGKGAPHKQGTAGIHGSPLGADEIKAAKEALGIPSDFYVAPEAKVYFDAKKPVWKKAHEDWKANFDAWSKENPDLRKEWDAWYSGKVNQPTLPVYKVGDKAATRKAGNDALVAIAKANANLVGGAADLMTTNAVALPPEMGAYSPEDRKGRYIHWGIREFAMAAICNGMSLHGGVRPFCATFLVFSDYLRGALRLSAIMKQPVIYVLTHDSIMVGEDGPTHQPVEHLAALRAMPNVRVLRPGDPEECGECWVMAMERKNGPTALIHSRQGIAVYVKDDPDWRNTIRCAAYIVKKVENPEVVVIATGAEVGLALDAAKISSKKVQVVSMPSRELFEAQPETIQNAIIPAGVRTVVCEAQIAQGWERWAKPADILCMKGFGASGPAAKVAEHFGFTAENLAKIIG
jgi:transketolase